MKHFIILLCFFNSLIGNSSEKLQETSKKNLGLYQKISDTNLKLYKQIVKQNIKHYYKLIGKEWGDDTFFSDKKKIVYYSKDYKEREVIDFEKGKVEVEIIAPKKPKIKVFEKKLRQLKKQSINNGAKKELIYKNTNSKIPKKYSDITKEILPGKTNLIPQNIKSHKLSNGKTSYKIKVPLKRDYLYKLARLYIPVINKYARKYKIDRAYVLAIIQQESGFNPKARSKAFALGLMQLVPKTGGRDAYKKITNQDKEPSVSYLFNPENNIRLGMAYIYIIQTDYLRGVYEIGKLYLCTSAAYNTGIGNLYKGIASTNNKNKAIKKINALVYNSLYERITDTTRFHRETVDYVQKVLKFHSRWSQVLE